MVPNQVRKVHPHLFWIVFRCQSEFHELLAHRVDGFAIDVDPQSSGAHRGERHLLHGIDRVIDCALIRRKLSAHRVCPRRVRRIPFHLGADIGEHQTAAIDGGVIFLVVQCRRVRARCDDRRICERGGAHLAECRFDHRLHVAFVGRSSRPLHPCFLSGEADVDRALHERDLGGTLDLPHGDKHRPCVAKANVGMQLADVLDKRLLLFIAKDKPHLGVAGAGSVVERWHRARGVGRIAPRSAA